jgi:divalent metal cation (Fe/Co/Zn/Cd) transporter
MFPSTTSLPAPAISEQPSKPTMRAANAGIMLLVVICLCALVGYALGSLVGLPIAIGLAGLIIGPIVGVAFVRSRFRDL